MLHQCIEPRWKGETCIVAATGPSLTPDVAAACRGHRTIAVNDAYRLLPEADVLFACDAAWWKSHKGCREFRRERWSSHGRERGANDKLPAANEYGLNLVQGRSGETFSVDGASVCYGSNSGFQAVNLAILFGAATIVLVGFDMRLGSNGLRHFFGDHPLPLRNSGSFNAWIRAFNSAAKQYTGAAIVNCTPGSALRCFPTANLNDALAARRRSAPLVATLHVGDHLGRALPCLGRRVR